MNESLPLVSVIVPIYNKHKCLHRGLHSILAQTYPNMQIIVVDDCSTDSSPIKAKRILADCHNHLIIHNDKNLGLLKSRYIGISRAQGTYTTFMDADDWMEPKAIELMVEAMLTYNTDLVQIRNQRRMRGVAVKYQEQFSTELSSRLIEGEEFRELASYIGMDSYIHPACWGKLYHTRKLREAAHMDFNQFWGEDQIFNIQYLRECRSMVFCDYIGYNYRWGGQTSSSYKFSALKEYKYVHNLKRMFGQNEARINAEIIMLLRYHIRSLFTELGYTREAIVMIMNDELRDPLWRQAGLDVSCEELVNAEYNEIQRSPIKYIAKRLLK